MRVKVSGDNQFHYIPNVLYLVAPTGFEPVTFPLSAECSTRLSYGAKSGYFLIDTQQIVSYEASIKPAATSAALRSLTSVRNAATVVPTASATKAAGVTVVPSAPAAP